MYTGTVIEAIPTQSGGGGGVRRRRQFAVFDEDHFTADVATKLLPEEVSKEACIKSVCSFYY